MVRFVGARWELVDVIPNASFVPEVVQPLSLVRTSKTGNENSPSDNQRFRHNRDELTRKGLNTPPGDSRFGCGDKGRFDVWHAERWEEGGVIYHFP